MLRHLHLPVAVAAAAVLALAATPARAFDDAAGRGGPFAIAGLFGSAPDRPSLLRGGARNADYARRTVRVETAHAPGTIIIDTGRRYLYLVQDDGTAIRYGVGVGRPGFEWAGIHRVTRKAEWPDWRPPDEMRARQPYLPSFMPGGPDNPLGARALYLGSTLYRIHGTNEAHTIGHAVSSGCIRMLNEDVIDLYNRVGVGTRVVVF